MQHPCASQSILVLLFMVSLPNPTSGDCTQHTCLNNGTCDTSSKEKGFKCICPQLGLADYGPRCELVVRSYVAHDPSVYLKTKHALSDHPFFKDSMTITFDFNAQCYSFPCTFFQIIGPDGSPFVTFELFQLQLQGVYEIHIWSPAYPTKTYDTKADSIYLKGTEMLSQTWRENWQSMHLHMWKNSSGALLIRAQLCSLKMMTCLEATAKHQYHGDLQSKLSQSAVLIGKFDGCVRYPRINGVLMDLGNVIGFEGVDKPHLHTFPYCYLSAQSCMRFDGIPPTYAAVKNYCGKDSECSPSLTSCTCRCISAKRRPRETIADSDKCKKGSWPVNECTIDTPVLVTVSSNYDVKWTAQNDGPISVGLRFFSIEAMVRTRQTNVREMLTLTNGKELLPQIRISDGHLEVCIGASCYPFPKVFVADDQWHSLSVTIRSRELTAMLDMSTAVHVLTSAFNFQAATVTVSIPDSCVRAVRLSNVYMPTGDIDVTSDNATAYIKVHRGSGVSAASSCTCKCGAFEDCDESLEATKCKCKADFVRDKDGSCTHSVLFSLHELSSKMAQQFGAGCTAIFSSFTLLLLVLYGC